MRVQITSAASAQNPDSAMATYTITTSDLGSVTGKRSASNVCTAVGGDIEATSNPSPPTMALMPTATSVAVVISKTRSR